jgi:hypothetical protein
MATTKSQKKSTTELIAEYNLRIANRGRNCHLGSTRWVARQRVIDEIVDELSVRSGAGDVAAQAWMDES